MQGPDRAPVKDRSEPIARLSEVEPRWRTSALRVGRPGESTALQLATDQYPGHLAHEDCAEGEFPGSQNRQARSETSRSSCVSSFATRCRFHFRGEQRPTPAWQRWIITDSYHQRMRAYACSQIPETHDFPLRADYHIEWLYTEHLVKYVAY